MAQTEQECRQAAESLLHSSGHPVQAQNPYEMSHSHSINTIPSLHPDYIISEDLLAGNRLNGRMSNVRRFFCLFVTFDLLFTGLMWLICVMLKGENIMAALNEQIYHYDIHTSLFDLVLLAVCRFVVLLLFYAIIYLQHWIVIAVSTAITTIFMIAKVFTYDFPHSSQPVFEVLLVVVSFILAWGEAWFLDFRVLPQESYARRYFVTNPATETAPLVRSYVHGLPSQYTESVGNFYSPLVSPEGSVHRFDSRLLCKYPSVLITREMEEEYKVKIARTMQEVWDLLHRGDWHLEREAHEVAVSSLAVPVYGRIFKLRAKINTSPKFLLEELFYRVENIVKWNPTLMESHKVQVIDEHTDISYQISAVGAGGLVKSRDFVSLRHWDFIEGRYIIASTATDHPSLPDNDKYVRGENRAGCWSMQVNEQNPNQCTFEWILNTKLNGRIPAAVQNKAFVGMMFEYVRYLKQHVATCQES